jgi:hypothetical protein
MIRKNRNWTKDKRNRGADAFEKRFRHRPAGLSKLELRAQAERAYQTWKDISNQEDRRR